MKEEKTTEQPDKEELEARNEMLSVEKVPTKNVLGTFVKPDENIEDDIEKYPEPPEVLGDLKQAQKEADKIVQQTTESGGSSIKTSRHNENDGKFQKDIKNKAKNRTQKAGEPKQNSQNIDIEKTR